MFSTSVVAVGTMTAGQFWTPPTTVNVSSAVEQVEMLNLFHNADVCVDELDYVSTAPEPYIHVSPRVAALVFHDDVRAIYIKQNGSCRNAFETEALQRNLGMMCWTNPSSTRAPPTQPPPTPPPPLTTPPPTAMYEY